jgi:alpha-1,3-rhamnosyl/mannosyltransferase
MELAGQLGIGDRLVLPGDAPLEDLVALYCGAEAFLYPSVYEGFGMPVLEAMACGCPVITSDRSSLPEVAGGAALLVDPASADAIRGAITEIARNATLRGQLVQLGGQRAAALTWDATAEGMLRVFDRVLAARGITGGGAG